MDHMVHPIIYQFVSKVLNLLKIQPASYWEAGFFVLLEEEFTVPLSVACESASEPLSNYHDR